MNKVKNTCFNVFLFIGIGLAILFCLNRVFTPKWVYGNPYSSDYAGEIINGLYLEEKNSLDYVVLGPSHSLDAISPMEIYSDYGIKGYNMSTNNQCIELSFYLLSEVIKMQSPEVVVLDVSGLFIQDADKAPMQIAFDSMKFSKNKLCLAKQMCNMFSEYTTFFDIYGVFKYHDRWKSLTNLDFNMSPYYQNNLKGYWICANIKAGISVEEMNSVENIIIQNMGNNEIAIRDGDFELSYKGVDYLISDNNKKWLSKLKGLCDDKGAKLILVAVPSVQLPQRGKQVWTETKSAYMKKFASEMKMDFFDLLYDYNTDADWKQDTTDGGYHLNIKGAKKISSMVGEILVSRFIQRENTLNNSELWGIELEKYHMVEEVALLQSEQDLKTYLELLSKNSDDYIVYFSSADEMTLGLSPDEKKSLYELGCDIDLDNSFADSFLGVLTNGKFVILGKAKKDLTYCDEFDNKQIELCSSGYYSYSTASIKIDGEEYAQKSRGINIVVYYKRTHLVIDSVAFDTNVQPDLRVCSRNEKQFSLLKDYEMAVCKKVGN